MFFSSPTYPGSIDLLQQSGVNVFKIASPQAAAYPQLVEKAAVTRKPVILSTGLCTEEDIQRIVKVIRDTGNDKIALLHCISEYPVRPEKVNLRYMNTLKQKFQVPVGFSDHTLGRHIALAAVAAGADIIEKHVTMSRKMDGPDHFFAAEPAEFESMVSEIRDIEASIGTGIKRGITDAEAALLTGFRMRALAAENVSSGAAVDKNKDIVFRRDNDGIDAWRIFDSEKITAKKDIAVNNPITEDSVHITVRKE